MVCLLRIWMSNQGSIRRGQGRRTARRLGSWAGSSRQQALAPERRLGTHQLRGCQCCLWVLQDPANSVSTGGRLPCFHALLFGTSVAILSMHCAQRQGCWKWVPTSISAPACAYIALLHQSCHACLASTNGIAFALQGTCSLVLTLQEPSFVAHKGLPPIHLSCCGVNKWAQSCMYTRGLTPRLPWQGRETKELAVNPAKADTCTAAVACLGQISIAVIHLAWAIAWLRAMRGLRGGSRPLRGNCPQSRRLCSQLLLPCSEHGPCARQDLAGSSSKQALITFGCGACAACMT